MNESCATVQPPSPYSAKCLVLFLLAAAMIFWGAYLLLYGSRADLVVQVIIFLGGVAVMWEALNERRLPGYEISNLWICRESDCRKLDSLRRVELDWHRKSPLQGWTPALLLRVGSEAWKLPLSLEGWEKFWDCLRKLRPDLSLPDWRRLKVVHEWIKNYPRYGLALPEGVEVSRPGTISRTLADAAGIVLLNKAWQLLAGNRSLAVGMLLAAAGTVLGEYLLRLVWPPRIVAAPWLEGGERTETPSTER
ncbi:hypothetical protein [Oceanithermus sp.]